MTEDVKPSDVVRKHLTLLYGQGFEYIARDESGDLYIFGGKPEKDKTFGGWLPPVGDDFYRQIPRYETLSGVKWEESEPRKLAELLGIKE